MYKIGHDSSHVNFKHTVIVILNFIWHYMYNL